jgi:site-specific recombinase XerD
MLFEHIPLKRQGKFARIALCPVFDAGLKAYSDYCREMGYSESGTFTRLDRIKRMLIFFESKGVSNLDLVTAALISDFIKTQIDQESRTVAAMLSAIRCFFRELYLQKMIGQDLSDKVPKLKANRKYKLPKIWKTEEFKNYFLQLTGKPHRETGLCHVIDNCTVWIEVHRCSPIETLFS